MLLCCNTTQGIFNIYNYPYFSYQAISTLPSCANFLFTSPFGMAFSFTVFSMF